MDPTMLWFAIQFTVYAASPVPETDAFVVRITTYQECQDWKRAKDAMPPVVLDKTTGRQIVYRGYACAITDSDSLKTDIEMGMQDVQREAQQK